MFPDIPHSQPLHFSIHLQNKTAATVLAAVAASAGPTMAVGCTLPYWLRYAITLTGISCREEIFKIKIK